ncbi:hypothetical protein PV327_004564 [Microctonus hyperodae]|uniref:Apoptosis regulatory protein Siva n=1 Tax=Microctonus hyperodae TaxID=165561 RepID=A0AA39KMT2_MICHY|nr:hypothetical protein PV327_004564 [Microctonus hyperodae]
MSSPPLHTSFKQLFNTHNAETMNKRSCPFEEDLCPQLKVHVGPKEASDGNSKEELKKIYENTMALLKNGSKLIKDVVNIDHHEKIRGYHFESPRFKQMIMNDKLQLKMSEKLIVNLDKQICSNCGELGISDRSCCFHCIDYYCLKCLSECSKCSEQFCPKCTFTIYEGGEHIECLECYR